MTEKEDSTQKVRIGQVGIGYWGRNLFRNFAGLSSAEVVSVCDVSDSSLEGIRHQHPSVLTTSDYSRLLLDDSIDAIVVATQTPRHFEFAEAALKAGKHVFVEKPMTESVDEASRLVELSDEMGKHVMVGHLLMYHPAFAYVESLIDSGDLGEVYYLYSVRVNLGIVRQKENALLSLAPHDVAVALQFLKREPIGVSATGRDYLQNGVEDVSFISLHFDGGQIAHFHVSWLDPHKIRKVTVVGSQKMAVIDDVENSEKVRVYDKGVGQPAGERVRYGTYGEAMAVRVGDIVIPKIQMKEPLLLECQHFVDCVAGSNTPRSDARNGLAVVKILDAAQRSLERNGNYVALDEVDATVNAN